MIDLNQLAKDVVTQLTRIADAAEAANAGGVTKAPSGAAKTSDKAAATKTTAAKTTKAKVPSAEVVEKALLAVKDHELGGKDVAVGIFKSRGYGKMAEIGEEHRQEILDEATAKLAELDAAAAASLETDLDEDL